MKAVVFHAHGDLDQVAVADVPVPEIGADDVLLAPRAAALNRLDLWVLAGWPALKLKLPHVMGSDGAGVVGEFSDGNGVAIGNEDGAIRFVACALRQQSGDGRGEGRRGRPAAAIHA